MLGCWYLFVLEVVCVEKPLLVPDDGKLAAVVLQLPLRLQQRLLLH